MARQRRLAAAGHVHHVQQCGHNGQPIFLDDEDCAAFLVLLRNIAATERVAVHGYSLLDDEVHLLLTPSDPQGLSRLMQAIGRRHGTNFNRRHKRVGTLWAGRFRASIVEPDGWVLRCLCYLELCGSRGGAANDGRSPWSSASHHLGVRRESVITEHAAYWALGNTPFERESAWRRFMERGLTEADETAIQAAVRSGTALGSVSFKAKLGHELGRVVALRPVGRPRQRPRK